MKKIYLSPACQILAINLEQVITVSIGINNDENNTVNGGEVLTNRRGAWGCNSWPDGSPWDDGDK